MWRARAARSPCGACWFWAFFVRRAWLGPDLLEHPEVVQAAAEEQVHQRRVDVHRREDFRRSKPVPARQLPPLLGGVVAVEAGHAVGRVGGPVDEADAGLGEGTLELVVLDDDQAAGDPAAL